MRNKFACVSDPNTFISNSGDKYHVVYTSVVAPDGSISLVPSGKEDIQAYIDSFRDETDMAFIMARLQAGDTSVLTSAVPMYGDMTKMPQTYAEALQKIIDAENLFNQLPLNVRNSFDNDFKKWFAQSGTDSWYSKMADFVDKPADMPVADAVITDPIKEDVVE